MYDADGGLRGETAYVVGKLLGRRHCGLCDITHTYRRKPEWDAMVAELGIPFRLAHLNELTPAESQAMQHAGAPAVFTVGDDGRLDLLLDRARLEQAQGEVDRFAELVREALEDAQRL